MCIRDRSEPSRVAVDLGYSTWPSGAEGRGGSQAIGQDRSLGVDIRTKPQLPDEGPNGCGSSAGRRYRAAGVDRILATPARPAGESRQAILKFAIVERHQLPAFQSLCLAEEA